MPCASCASCVRQDCSDTRGVRPTHSNPQIGTMATDILVRRFSSCDQSPVIPPPQSNGLAAGTGLATSEFLHFQHRNIVKLSAEGTLTRQVESSHCCLGLVITSRKISGPTTDKAPRKANSRGQVGPSLYRPTCRVGPSYGFCLTLTLRTRLL